MKVKDFKHVLIMIFKSILHMHCLPYHSKGPPDQENNYYSRTIPLSVKGVILRRSFSLERRVSHAFQRRRDYSPFFH
jgi:hypothetical protein